MSFRGAGPPSLTAYLPARNNGIAIGVAGQLLRNRRTMLSKLINYRHVRLLNLFLLIVVVVCTVVLVGRIVMNKRNNRRQVQQNEVFNDISASHTNQSEWTRILLESSMASVDNENPFVENRTVFSATVNLTTITPVVVVNKASTASQMNDDETIDYRRRFVRKMMKHAWDGYVQYAFGHNEIAPIRKQPHLTGTFGDEKLGASIVDALDTLWIMGLRDEFDRGRQWVAHNFSLSGADAYVSVFETNIRFLGGLLSAYSLSGDEMFLRKADELGQTLMAAFNTSSGIPWPVFDFKHNRHREGATNVLADVGTFHLEFAYLSKLTGNQIFLDKAVRIRDQLDTLDKSPDGLYRDHIEIGTGNWSADRRHTNAGSLGDSFYEYLFKSWLWSNRTDTTAKRMYDEAMEAVDKHLVAVTPTGHVFVRQRSESGIWLPQVDHVACFVGGLYALSAPYAHNTTHYDIRAIQLADMCHFASISTKTGFAPELFRFGLAASSPPVMPLIRTYFLRPEIVETYFVMWRTTGDSMYREWGWAVAQAIETHCRAEAGYSGLHDIDSVNPSLLDDVQPSFFLAETLKYLYLLFVDETDDGQSTAADDGGIDISLDEYVFNTEAHPLPILRSRKFPISTSA